MLPASPSWSLNRSHNMKSWRGRLPATANVSRQSKLRLRAVALQSLCSIPSGLRAILKLFIRRCGKDKRPASRRAISPSEAASLLANDQAFLDQPLDENNLFVVFEFAGDIADRVIGRLQREIERCTEKSRKHNASAAEIKTYRILARMELINDASPRPDIVCQRQRCRLEEIKNLS